MVAGDIVEQFKKSERLEEQDENAHDGEEVVEKAAQQVEIDDGVNARSGDRAGSARAGPFSGAGCAILGAGVAILPARADAFYDFAFCGGGINARRRPAVRG